MRSLRNFFKKYGNLSLGTDPEAIAEFYWESFIAAGPKGAMTFKNDRKFIDWLKELQTFNAESGMTEMKLVKIKTTAVGKLYTSSNVTWAVGFEKMGAELIQFDITYLVFHSNSRPKIVMYISHEDQEELMKNKGLI